MTEILIAVLAFWAGICFMGFVVLRLARIRGVDFVADILRRHLT